MRKPQKIFYVSGIISLLFIAPLFWFLAQPTLKDMNLRVMDVGVPYKAKKGEESPEYSQIPMDGWNYEPVKIPANFRYKEEKKFIRLVENLQKERIEKSGLQFIFSNENSYGDLVKMLNIMLKTKQEFYGIDMEKSNSIYVLYMNPGKNYFGSDVVYIDSDGYYYSRSSLFEKIKLHSPNGTYYIIFGFLILVYSSILKPKLL